MFFDTWRKYRDGRSLQGIEGIVLDIILQHPEYQAMLDQPDRYLDRDWRPEDGETNPFLHMSLHVGIEEQLALDSPAGIRATLDRLQVVEPDRHAALHRLLDCLAEAMWVMQRDGLPDPMPAYLECLKHQLGEDK